MKTIEKTSNFTAEDLMGAIVNMGADAYIIEDEEQAAEVAESLNNATYFEELKGEDLEDARERLECPGASRVLSFVDGSACLVSFSEDWEFPHEASIKTYKTNASLFVDEDTYFIDWDGLTFYSEDEYQEWLDNAVAPADGCKNRDEIRNLLEIATNYLKS